MLRRQDCKALITAAGLSARMGQPKALLPWGSVALVQHQAQVLAGFRDVVVVVGHDAAVIEAAASLVAPARYVENPEHLRGRSSSLACGARALADAGGTVGPLLVVAVDQPLEPAVVDALLEAFVPASHTLVQPSFKGRRGHPLLLGAAAGQALCSAEDYSEGLRDIVRAHASGADVVPVMDASTRWDLNTPERFAAALAALGDASQ
ncbi:MAG: molybdenum cofactor cytidylyltransferase [Myxococcota bacterium]|jgi:molybdenum cofactor cytidylyltransferase